MSPQDLIGPVSPLGYPAPYPVLAVFKGLGFVLHMGMMHLWFAGLPLAVVLYWRGGEHARHWAGRLAKQMPVIIAMGVNFGILALLFLQVTYYRTFYPATILMAWPWFSIFVGLTFAYYGAYIYEIGLKRDTLTPAKRAAGWLAALVFLVEGFLFTNALSLMTNVGGWPALWQQTSVAGAPLGTALNTVDPTLWPRWLFMFGLALTTTAVYVLFDAALFCRQESEEYRRWAGRFGFRLYTVGLVWFAAVGSWYVFGTWRPEARQVMFAGPHLVLTVLTALSPGLPWLLALAQRNGVVRRLAWAAVAAQFAMLTVNALSRQIVQNVELRPFVDVAAEPVRMQWSAALFFVVMLLAGLALTGWIVAKVWEVEQRSDGVME